MKRPDIDAIQARCDAATPGPWRCYSIKEVDFSKPGPIHDGAGRIIAKTYTSRDNDEFIAHARQDIPDLLAYVRGLEEALRFYANTDNYLLTWRAKQVILRRLIWTVESPR